MNSRKVVLNTLIKVEEGCYSNLLANTFFEYDETAFIYALFYGVIERKITLDYILNKFLNKSIDKQNLYIKNLLRMGAYEAVFMNTPIYAVVNEYVSLIKKSKFKGLSGLVNAILRKIPSFDINTLKKQDEEVRYSINNSVKNIIYKAIGKEEGENFLKNSLKTPPIFVRINKLKNPCFKIPNNFIETSINNTYEVKKFSSNDTAFINGEYYIQDISATESVLMANPQKNEKILDLCAAPGGKSFTAYLLSNGEADITSCDVSEKRLQLMQESANKLGFKIKINLNDASVYNESLGLYDLVICDVPCSGFGVIRRKPEVKYKNESDISSIVNIQKNIVDNAVKYLKPDGRLLYSTCTLNVLENEDMVKYILEKNSDLTCINMNTFLPKNNNGDGFFAALLKKVKN